MNFVYNALLVWEHRHEIDGHGAWAGGQLLLDARRRAIAELRVVGAVGYPLGHRGSRVDGVFLAIHGDGEGLVGDLSKGRDGREGCQGDQFEEIASFHT